MVLLLRKERKTGNEQNWENSEKDIDHLWVTLGKADSPRSSAEVEAVVDLDLEWNRSRISGGASGTNAVRTRPSPRMVVLPSLWWLCFLFVKYKEGSPKKNVFYQALPEREGGRPLPTFFCHFSPTVFLVKKKESSPTETPMYWTVKCCLGC